MMQEDWTEERIRKTEGTGEMVEILISLWKKGKVFPAEMRDGQIVWSATSRYN